MLSISNAGTTFYILVGPVYYLNVGVLIPLYNVTGSSAMCVLPLSCHYDTNLLLIDTDLPWGQNNEGQHQLRNYHLKANHDSVVIMDDEYAYLFTGNVKK